jgi:hypothetical protein
MKSFVAALRSLSLPFGITSGTRIILDGILGKISMFNSTNEEVISMDSAQNAIVVTGSDQSKVSLTAGGGYAAIDLLPPHYAGVTWDQGEVRTEIFLDAIPYPYIAIQSPRNMADGSTSYLNLFGGVSADSSAAAELSANRVIIRADSCDIRGRDTGAASVTIDGNPVISRVGSNTNIADETFTNVEKVTDSVTFNAISGVTYGIKLDAAYKSTVAGDIATIRIRENNVSGATVRAISKNVDPGFNTECGAYTEWIATSSGTKTFVVTGLRASGTGTVTRIGSSISPSILVATRTS